MHVTAADVHWPRHVWHIQIFYAWQQIISAEVKTLMQYIQGLITQQRQLLLLSGRPFQLLSSQTLSQARGRLRQTSILTAARSCLLLLLLQHFDHCSVFLNF